MSDISWFSLPLFDIALILSIHSQVIQDKQKVYNITDQSTNNRKKKYIVDWY